MNKKKYKTTIHKKLLKTSIFLQSSVQLIVKQKLLQKIKNYRRFERCSAKRAFCYNETIILLHRSRNKYRYYFFKL